MTKNCKTCAWYCHSDGLCYGIPMKPFQMGTEVVLAIGYPPIKNGCEYWAFDGLEEWEREETEALMTMEPA